MTSTKSEAHFAQKGDYKEIKALWDATFKEDSPAWRSWYFEHIYKPENCLVLKREGRIVSMAHINPYPMMLNLKKIPSAALAGIATEEAARGRGYAAYLIKESLKEMRKRGTAFSFLYPFDYDFYRKYGYEQCYENRIYTATGANNGQIDLIPTDESAQTAKIYEKYTQALNGYIIRDEAYQKIKLLEHLADGNTAYIIKRKSDVLGYALAQEQDEKIVLGELICREPEKAAGAIAQKHNKPVEFISPYMHEGLNCEAAPHCMGRVTDVPGVFDAIPAKSGEMVVRVSDDIIAQNSGNYLFSAKAGRLKAERTDAKEDVCADIKELAPVAAGYPKTMSANARKIYDAFFDEKTPWIAEVC